MKKLLLLITLVAWVIAFAQPGQATLLDLTTLGSSGTINGAIFSSPTSTVSGTGLIDSFVRIKEDGTEQGYNVDIGSNIFQYNELAGPYTHSLKLYDIQNNIYVDVVTSISYYEFVLDINENASGRGRLLSMHELEIYLHNTGDVLNHSSGWGTPIYDLDFGIDGDSEVKLDYKNFPGSGKLDMIALIPTALFGTDLDQYVCLYSAFGSTNASDNGFEEWAHKLVGTFSGGGGGGGDPIPEPATMLLLGSGLIGIAVSGKKRFKKRNG